MSTGGAVRVQIHLKYIFAENLPSTKEFYRFWYAFQPSQLTTIDDILRDIRLNYLKDQFVDNEQAFIIQLDDCQLLPFSSSQILRDNDRLTMMPLANYQLHRVSLQDSIALDSSPPAIEQPSNNHKRQRVESVENNIPSASTIIIAETSTAKNLDDQPSKKKKKTTTTEAEIIPPEESASPLSTSAILKAISDEPLSFPSTIGYVRELKSKTPVWKSKQPPLNENSKDKVHIRFDSESDDEPLIEKKPASLPLVNGSNSSVRVQYHVSPPASSSSVDVIEEKPKKKSKQKKKQTIDLLFEMKQYKAPAEQEGKKIQQQFGRKRAQHRKRTLDYFSLANFVDHAFGLEKTNGDQQQHRDSRTSSSSSPQTLPTSFNKLGRLPLIAEAIKTNEKIYDLYPPILQCPSVRTRLAFKILELSDDFCPKMSEFKEGTVIDVNSTTEELTIELDKPLQTIFDQPSKFYAPADDDVEPAVVITLPFSELNSVRQLSSENAT